MKEGMLLGWQCKYGGIEREASRNDVTLDGSPTHLESICLNTTLHILLFLVFFCRYGLLASFVDEIYVWMDTSKGMAKMGFFKD